MPASETFVIAAGGLAGAKAAAALSEQGLGARIRQHGGQRPVRPLTLGEPGSPVQSRAHQRVAELDAITSDPNQALRLGTDSAPGSSPSSAAALATVARSPASSQAATRSTPR